MNGVEWLGRIAREEAIQNFPLLAPLTFKPGKMGLKRTSEQAWWHALIVIATQEAGVEGSLETRSWGSAWAI